MDDDLSRINWNAAYISGKYSDERPVEFIDEVVRHIQSRGFNNPVVYYPGCGNGRNFPPLLKAGIQIVGEDISDVAIKHLEARYSAEFSVGDFLAHDGGPYDFILSIQLFQHGDGSTASSYFTQVAKLLNKKGLLFLRVNSVSTQIIEDHEILNNTHGSKTIKYNSGPKLGQTIHFYSLEELEMLARSDLLFVNEPYEDKIFRSDGTYWSQWQMILERK